MSEDQAVALAERVVELVRRMSESENIGINDSIAGVSQALATIIVGATATQPHARLDLVVDHVCAYLRRSVVAMAISPEVRKAAHKVLSEPGYDA